MIDKESKKPLFKEMIDLVEAGNIALVVYQTPEREWEGIVQVDGEYAIIRPKGTDREATCKCISRCASWAIDEIYRKYDI